MPQQQRGKFKSPCDLLTLGCLPSVWVRASYSRNHSYPYTRPSATVCKTLFSFSSKNFEGLYFTTESPEYII